MRLSDWVQKPQRSNNGHELFLKNVFVKQFFGETFFISWFMD